MSSFMRDLLLRRFEAVSRSADCPEITGFLGVNFNLGPQLSYVHVYRAWAHESGIFPDRIKNLVTAKDAAGVAGKVMQQSKLRCRGGNDRAAHGEDHGEGVNFEIARLDHRGRGRRFTAPQDGLDSRYQLTRAEWLGDVIVRADFQAPYAVSFTVSRRHKNDGRAAQRFSGLAYLAAKFDSVSAGNHDIQQQQSGAFLERVRQNGVRGGVNSGTKSRSLKMVAHKTRNVSIIFNDENLLPIVDCCCDFFRCCRLFYTWKRSIQTTHTTSAYKDNVNGV